MILNTNQIKGGESSYLRVNYIEATGSQYIDTGYYPNSSTRVIMDYQGTSIDSTWHGIFGARDGPSNSYANSFSVWQNPSGQYATDFGPNTNNAFGTLDTERHLIDKNRNIITVDDVSFTNTSATFTCNYTMILANGRAGDTVNYYANMRIYSCKIYDNDVLVRDFVPCVSGAGIFGLYDFVDKKFYTSVGSGAFTGA